jgi:hypothetical protein
MPLETPASGHTAIDEVFATHLQKRRQYYAMERRWHTEFWRGMQQQLTKATGLVQSSII